MLPPYQLDAWRSCDDGGGRRCYSRARALLSDERHLADQPALTDGSDLRSVAKNITLALEYEAQLALRLLLLRECRTYPRTAHRSEMPIMSARVARPEF